MTYNQAIKKFNYSGRKTLRTVFDYLSHEWTDTLLSEKSCILNDLITEKYTLTYYLEQYINFYAKELYNKDYVILAIPKSLDIIYRKSEDKVFKKLIKEQYLLFLLYSEIYLEYQLEIPAFIKKDIVFKEYTIETKEETFEDVIFITKYNYLELYREIAVLYEAYELAEKIKLKIEVLTEKLLQDKIIVR